MSRTVLPLALLCAICGLSHAAEKTTETEISVSHDTLNHGFDDWRGIEARWLHRSQAGGAMYGTLREVERFSLDDRELFVGGYLPLSADWAAVVEGSVSPSHEVLARWSAFGQLQRRFSDGWNLQVGFRRTEYSHARTGLTSLTAERYWQNYRAAITAYSGTLDGAGNYPSGRMQLDYYYGDGSRIGFSFAAGREAENLGPAGVLVSRVRDAALIGNHWINRAWAMTYVLNVHRQGDIYTRHGFELGLRRRF